MEGDEDVIRPINRQLPKERIMEPGDLVTYPYDNRSGYSHGVVVSVLSGSIILDTYTADHIRIEVERMSVVLQYKKCEWDVRVADAMKQVALGNPAELPGPALEQGQFSAPTRRQPSSNEGVVRL